MIRRDKLRLRSEADRPAAGMPPRFPENVIAFGTLAAAANVMSFLRLSSTASWFSCRFNPIRIVFGFAPEVIDGTNPCCWTTLYWPGLTKINSF